MLCLLLAVGLLAPGALIDSDLALSFTGEVLPVGECAAAVVPADGATAGSHTLRLTFTLTERQASNWLDCFARPEPALDLSAATVARLPVRVHQPSRWLRIKLTDPDNPGANRSAYEGELMVDGAPLPVGQWVEATIPLPADPLRRDGLDYVGFYLACFDESVPLGVPLVVDIGQFDYRPPARPPWPPTPVGADRRRALPVPPLAPGPAWELVSGRDIQTAHTARFVAGGVEYIADAEGWNEFLHSRQEGLPLRPETSYLLQYDYTVLAAPDGGGDAMFYQLVRAAGTIQRDVGWQRWGGQPGEGGRRLVRFTTTEADGYYLIFGVRHHGGIRLENIRLMEAGGQEAGR